ncbi:unnamed protein product [Adineta steineri]|uniref:Uncharacterized protein n=1 Tax=Adineta steineri TaxID=433720 RepID=A0A814TFS3_9BILA|nr:unnamed protein product [Adineta steineri]CAF1159014.1 unnamed protein product [Adineta steineri]
MIRILLTVYLLCFIEIHAIRRRCINSGVLFSDQIARSPLIVYGESLAKNIYVESDTESLFNVTFRIDCILKGQIIESQIKITDAGIKAGHMACQWLDPGQYYVVFLEKWGTNPNEYRPLDFQEHIGDNTTYELLTKTCHLTKNLPLHSTTNNCPNVSFSGFCPHDSNDIIVIPKQGWADTINTNARSSYFDHGSLFQLQSNVTVPRDPIMSQTRYISNNSARSAIISEILFAIGIFFMILGY